MLLLFNCISRFIYRVTNELHFFIQRKRKLKMLIIVNAVTIQVRQTFFHAEINRIMGMFLRKQYKKLRKMLLGFFLICKSFLTCFDFPLVLFPALTNFCGGRVYVC